MKKIEITRLTSQTRDISHENEITTKKIKINYHK